MVKESLCTCKTITCHINIVVTFQYIVEGICQIFIEKLLHKKSICLISIYALRNIQVKNYFRLIEKKNPILYVFEKVFK